jgi:hypothetical protein
MFLFCFFLRLNIYDLPDFFFKFSVPQRENGTVQNALKKKVLFTQDVQGQKEL